MMELKGLSLAGLEERWKKVMDDSVFSSERVKVCTLVVKNVWRVPLGTEDGLCSRVTIGRWLVL